ncbi:MAG: hypothetical protein EZS28_005384 [Streblomastix strix]|uniref:Uncharacterized protein n=1 Tax=Streblomastix strix TaxID=222440 RepID=A0A5J4WVQ0_9EUKA|nr:MAG: hypothetical protein EZS28_005384 [Streblomastix strix]
MMSVDERASSRELKQDCRFYVQEEQRLSMIEYKNVGRKKAEDDVYNEKLAQGNIYEQKGEDKITGIIN